MVMEVILKKLFLSVLLTLSLHLESAPWTEESVFELGVVGVSSFIGGAAGNFIGHSVTGMATSSIDEVTPQRRGLITGGVNMAIKGYQKKAMGDAGINYVVPLVRVMGTCAGFAFGKWAKESVVKSGKNIYQYYVCGQKENAPSKADYINVSVFSALSVASSIYVYKKLF